MTNEEKISLLLADIRNLEELVNGIKNFEIYPVSFFSNSFDISQRIIKRLHTLEKEQLELLRNQLKAHEGLINTLKEPVSENKAELIEAIDPVPEIKDEPCLNREEIAEDTPEKLLPTPETIYTETVKEEKIEQKIIDQPEEKKEPEVLYQEKAIVSLIEVLEKKNLSDFRKAFSLNDRFRFKRELFQGDENLMNQTIADLNDVNSLERSLDYLSQKFAWNNEEEPVKDFIKLLEKRFL